jgi:uncharacterized protein YndB with AHSA1/START domain
MLRNVGNMTIDTPTDRAIVMSRVFEAPRELVFDAFTKPELVQRWLTGPPGWSMPICEIDLRVGGKYRYGWQNADGRKMGSFGEYREVVPPERVVATEQFEEAWYPGIAVGTTTFTQQEGKTTLSMTVEYDSQETRDMALKSGMETGVAYGFDLLAGVLDEMAKALRK